MVGCGEALGFIGGLFGPVIGTAGIEKSGRIQILAIFYQ